MQEKKVNKKKKRFTRDDIELSLLGIPTFIWYILFCYIPMFGIIIAFKKYLPLYGKGFIGSLIGSEWVGFNNFKFLFASPDAAIMFRNTILYNLVFIVLGTFLAVALAIMISELYSKRLAKICQTAMFLPHFLSWVVASYFVFSFLSVEKGLINNILENMGHEKVLWYMEPKHWPFIITISHLWKTTGYSMVVYLASISGIDKSLYEAAIIDGSTKWQQTKYITIPMLAPIISIMLIMAVGRIFSSDFGLFYILPRQSGPLFDVTQTIDVYVYRTLTSGTNIGMTASAGLLKSVLGFIVLFAANYTVSKINPENTLF
jgi:putative aldouronate transport system permease protein